VDWRQLHLRQVHLSPGIGCQTNKSGGCLFQKSKYTSSVKKTKVVIRYPAGFQLSGWDFEVFNFRLHKMLSSKSFYGYEFESLKKRYGNPNVPESDLLDDLKVFTCEDFEDLPPLVQELFPSKVAQCLDIGLDIHWKATDDVPEKPLARIISKMPHCLEVAGKAILIFCMVCVIFLCGRAYEETHSNRDDSPRVLQPNHESLGLKPEPAFYQKDFNINSPPPFPPAHGQ